MQGFDTLRLVGSLLVLFSHSYLIAQDTEASEPLQALLDGQKNIAGLYGVFLFFIVSGYLLARSLHHRSDAERFLIHRGLRLLPGFSCCVLITALIIGPLASRLGPVAYFADGGWLLYLKHSFLTLSDAPLPGVFHMDSSLASVVNGSLWSLSVEAASAVLLLACWLLLPSPGWVALVLALLGVTIFTHPAYATALPLNVYPLPFFCAGVVLWWLTHHLGQSRAVAHLCIAGLVAGFLLGFPHGAFACFGAYLVVHLGSWRSPLAGWIDRTGDLSYGIYLFGWPIQQLLRQQLDLRDPLLLFALSTLVTGICAWCLFHWVERPALALREPVHGWIRRWRQQPPAQSSAELMMDRTLH